MTPSHPPTSRTDLPHAARVVVKVGSTSLTGPDGRLDMAALRALVTVLAQARARGQQVVLVSSGAIAAGIGPLGLAAKPRDLATAQATASVGQGLLMAQYSAAFAEHGLGAAQVLLTADDVMRRRHYANAHRALERLLTLGVVPVVNENDTVATDEIRFGDNDRLAALTSHLVRADALVLLTDVDGLYDGPPSRAGSRLIREVRSPADLAGIEVTGRGSALGTGGMLTKVQAAQMATANGTAVLLTSARRAGEALAGAEVGTFFTATGRRSPARRLWLAHAAEIRGRLQLDAGAAHAVTSGKRSLLAAGITAVDGDFEAGDVVELFGPSGLVARGVSAYSSRDLPAMLGRSSDELRAAAHPDEPVRPVVHRDDLAPMGTEQ